ERWTDPELIGGEGTGLHGDIRVFANDHATLVTWVTNGEDYPFSGGILVKSFRRLAATDGKTWTPSRWIARRQSLRGKGVPESAPDVQAVIDANGRVHMVWSFAYCMVFDLDKDMKSPWPHKRRASRLNNTTPTQQDNPAARANPMVRASGCL